MVGGGSIIFGVHGTNAVKAQIPALRSNGAIIGTTVSGIFLFLIGIINVVIVLGIYRMFTTLKQGKMNESERESLLENRGFLNRSFKGLFKIFREPWQSCPLGPLFRLSFVTPIATPLTPLP